MRKRRIEQFVVVGFVLFFLLNLPFILIGNQPIAWAGIPVFYWYVGICWLLAIVAAFVIRRKSHE